MRASLVENIPLWMHNVLYIFILKRWYSVILIDDFWHFKGEIHHVINPDPYRGVFGSDASCYAKEVQDHIDYGTSGNVAGFIAETIQVYIIYHI